MKQEPSLKSPTVGFVGWNPFQFLHFGPLISQFPDATLVVEKRRSQWDKSSFDALVPDSSRVLYCDSRGMEKLDGKFDVLVCQTPFAGIENIRRSKIAMLQYGYAKEAHNFAPWRSFADVCLTFGDYASRKIEPFCPCVATGNPRYERWGDSLFQQTAREKYAGQLDPAKKTLLYAPTWGELSSYPQFGDAILALADEFNVIFKIHHISERKGDKQVDPIRRKFGVIHGAGEDIVELLAVADVMLTDFSGAIFDAIYCELPVVLLGSASAGTDQDSKSDHYSIEQAKRSELGEVVESTTGLRSAISRVLDTAEARKSALSAMREDLFTDATRASATAAEVIHDLANGGYGQTQSQHYIRQEMTQLHRCRAEFAFLRKVRRFLGIGGRRS